MDPFSASVETGVNFLAKLYQTGVGYSAINSARCALSTCILIGGCKSFGSHPLVCRFVRGVFESRPALPKYSETWYIKQVFKSDFLLNSNFGLRRYLIDLADFWHVVLEWCPKY